MRGRSFLIILVILLLLVGGGIVWYAKKANMLSGSAAAPTPAMGASVPEGWTSFKDPHESYVIAVPPDTDIKENGEFSRMILKKGSRQPTNFFYISTSIKGNAPADGVVYNYDPADIDTLRKLEVGASVTLPAGTFQRIEDRIAGGMGAKAFMNTSPHEFPQGTAEYRYIVQTEPVQYIIGAYVGGTGRDGMNRSQVDQILDTLILTPGIAKIGAIPTPSEWKTFTDTKAGISFSYPGGWQENTGQSFPDGDLFSLLVVGQTQRTQTELYDGARFSVMKPVATSDDVLSWMKKTYGTEAPEGQEKAPAYTTVTYGGISYDAVTVCGLGCFTYYHTKQNDNIYGFLLFATGGNENDYKQIFTRIMESVTYTAP